jgi:type II secretory pathway component PulF
MIYSYEAKDGGGRTVTGSLDALDERTAARQVREMGYFLMRLVPTAPHAPSAGGGNGFSYQAAPPLNVEAGGPGTPGTLSRLLHAFLPGVGLRDLALFYRQFAAMLNAGVPIYQCLTTLRATTSNPTLRQSILEISRRIQAGGQLSEAMAYYPWIFQDFHRAMIAAGEMTGRLDLMFARLSDALEQEYALRGVIKRETFYPALTLASSFLLQPDAVVALVVGGSGRGYLHYVLPPILECVAFVLGLVVVTRLGPQVKVFYDGVLSLLPGIGGAVRMIALARFARAMSLLYAAGLSVPNAVRAAAAACGNAYLGGRMVRAIPALEGGEGIAQSLMQTGAFPPMVITMLGVGEQTGDLDQTMTKVAEYFEQEAAVRLHQLGVTLGVAVTIFVGVRVAISVIHFYSGYFNNILNEAG